MSHRDQAAGLRALFQRREPVLVPVLDNPCVEGIDSLLDALVAAYLERGLKVLVVDAGARAQPAGELALLNLAACIESLSPHVGWLEARGLAAHYLDSRGSASSLLQRLREAAPQAEVIVLRAGAAELARILSGPQSQQAHAQVRPVRPVLLTDLQQQNLTAAYAGMKWLAERAGSQVFHLLIAGQPEARLTQRIARQLADTAERFLGVALAGWAGLPPGVSPAPNGALRRLAHDGLGTHVG